MVDVKCPRKDHKQPLRCPSLPEKCCCAITSQTVCHRVGISTYYKRFVHRGRTPLLTLVTHDQLHMLSSRPGPGPGTVL